MEEHPHESPFSLYAAEEVALQWAREIVQSLEGDEKWRESFFFRGVDLRDGVVNLLSREWLSSVAALLFSLEERINREKPEKIVFSHGSSVEEAISRFLASKKGISFVSSPLTGMKNRLLRPLKLLLKNGLRLLCDAFLCFWFALKGLLQKGNQNGSARVSDSPRLLFYIPFFTSPRRQMTFLRPIFEELKRKGWEILALGVKVRVVLDASFPARSFSFFPSFSWWRFLWRRVLDGVLLPEPAVTFPGFLFFLRDEIIATMKKDLFFHVYWWASFLLSSVQATSPALLMSMDCFQQGGRILGRIGEHLKIPSFYYGFGEFMDIHWYEGISFTRMAVFGEASKANLVKRGVDPASIVIAGNWQLDEFREEGKKSREEVCKTLSFQVSDGEKCILFASQPPYSANLPAVKERVCQGLARALLAHDGPWKLIVKLHPAEQDQICKKVFGSLLSRDRCLIVQEFPLYHLLSISHLLVTQYSSSGSEAVALGVPVLTVNFTGFRDISSYTEEGVGMTARDEGEIRTALSTMLYGEEFLKGFERRKEQFVFRHFYRVDSQSAARVVRAIEELAGSS